ncbi:MAG: TlpA family protein disulfide reductase [Polyangiaceae bacterium]|nr:TlpA family protein disulfide reductase [Polyangiaceae bacterium]
MHRASHQPIRSGFLGRLPPLSGVSGGHGAEARCGAAALLLAGLAVTFGGGGCERKDEKAIPPAPKSRNAAVASTASATANPAATLAPNPSVASRPKRVLCEPGLSTPGKSVPEVKMARDAAPGATPLAEKLPIGGQWTWVNFWAAWCVPCKEEIPLLLAWEQRLNAAGLSFQVAFVSLDDDARQLAAFLAEQPAIGVKATYWLNDLDTRGEWLDKVGIGSDPDLPEHLLVDPQGKIRCVVEGAIETSDYDRVRHLVGG